MAITNLPTKLTSVGNQGSASDYSSTSDASVFQFDYQDLDYTPKTTDDYKNDFEEELQVFINGIRIYRTDTDTGIDAGLTTNQKSRLTALTTSTFPWDIETSTKKVQINKTHASYGDTNTNNPGYPALNTWTIIKVIRIKPDKTTLATDFQSASVLTEAELDNAFSETFHVAQESIDTAQDSMTLGTDNIWDADNKNIKNIATPSGSDPSHYAVNKGYVDGSSTTVTVANNIANVNAVAGEISPTNNIATVANSAYKTDIETVADSTYKGKVETVAESVYKGKVETVADSTYKGKVETVAESVYKGKVETVADSTYKTKVEAVAGKETEVGRLGHADYSSGADAYLAKLGVDAFSNATNGYIKKVADIDSNVTTVAGVSENVTTVATNIDNVNAVAGSIAGSLTYTVTVAAYNNANYFYLDGTKNPTITLTRGFTYTFDQSEGTNAGHLLLFKDSAGNAYTNGVTSSGNLGQAGAKTVFVVPSNAPDSLRYYCSSHGNNMGNTITVVNNDLGAVAAIGASNLNTVATNAESNAIVMGIALG